MDGSSGGNGVEVSYFVVEDPTVFPGIAEISLALVRQAVKEFLSSGGSVRCVSHGRSQRFGDRPL
ncbi:Imm1 family immunity protein [Streptomyces sp. NPDC088256]|uniref:Imm1 family immunity protein n=1 Tax=Streptomyces sp. NPDC088256 TaxID=3365848 RepID=UPI00380A7C87